MFAGYFAHDNALVAYSGLGSRLPGWPGNAANFVASPPGLADVDGDGLDEIFIEEEIGYLHGYRANGSVLSGWPGRCNQAGQDLHTPAIGDLDGNGDLEIVSATSSTSGGGYLCAFHHDGSYVAGFPRLMAIGNDVFVAMGDVDGDGEQEIVLVGGDGEPGVVKILVLNKFGAIERSMIPEGEISGSRASPCRPRCGRRPRDHRSVERGAQRLEGGRNGLPGVAADVGPDGGPVTRLP